MVVNDTTKLFANWRRVVRLYVQITTGVKTGWDRQTRRTYALHSWYQYFKLVVVKSCVCIGTMIDLRSNKERWAWLLWRKNSTYSISTL